MLAEFKSNKLSIIIPTYNEKENLTFLLDEVNSVLGKSTEYEILIVDDNSSDGTTNLVKRLSNEYGNVKLLTRLKRMGLGSAYKDGLKLCSGDVVVEMDADLSHDPSELLTIVEALGGADLVVGSRHVDGGEIVGWRWHRKLINVGANLLARAILGLRVKDSTSGFRAYRRGAFDRIASMSIFDGFEFQVEAIYIARKLGLKMVEVPITFRNRRFGNTKLRLKDIIDFAKAVLKMRFIHDVKT